MANASRKLRWPFEKLPSSVTNGIPQNRKKLRLFWDYHTTRIKKQHEIRRGIRPDGVKIRRAPSRLLTKAQKGDYKNVIVVARMYRDYLNRADVLGYRQVAEHFGVTKATISYYLKFLTLPESFVDWLGRQTNPIVLSHFGMKVLREASYLEEASQVPRLLSEAQKMTNEFELARQNTQLVDELIVCLQSEPTNHRELRVIDIDG